MFAMPRLSSIVPVEVASRMMLPSAFVVVATSFPLTIGPASSAWALGRAAATDETRSLVL